MVNEFLKQYLEHPKRKWITWATTGVVCLLFVVPAWDDFAAAQTEFVEFDTELQEMTLAASSAKEMKAKMQAATSQLDLLDKMIDDDRANQIREDVTQLAHDLNCQMRRLTLGNPQSRPWGQHEVDPFDTSTANNSESSDCKLETRHLDVSVEGTLPQLSKLTIALTRLNRFAVPTEMILQRERVNGQLRLDIDLSLFNLVESNDR